MDNSLVNENILYQKNITLPNKLIDFNIRSIYNNDSNSNLGNESKSFEDRSSNRMDIFSTVLLSKSEINMNNENQSLFNDIYTNNSLYKSASYDSTDKIDRNSSCISFFKDLKDYFTQNLFEKLRKCVNEIYLNDIKHFKICNNDFITITPEEMRDRALLLKKFMNSPEINIIQIYLALRERYKIIETNSVPSVGSLLHNHGFCKPCVFANKKSNYCKSGFGCNFCHYNHKLYKSKGGNKSYARLSSQTEFFNKLIRTPSGEETLTNRSNTTDDSFSLTSSSTSLLSITELKTISKRDQYNSNMSRFHDTNIFQNTNGNEMRY